MEHIRRYGKICAFSIHISTFSSNSSLASSPPMQMGTPKVVQKRLGSNIKNIHFEHGVLNKSILSPNHWWKISSTNYVSFIHVNPNTQDPQEVESLKKDVLQAVVPYIQDNVLRLDYLITKAIKS